MENPAGSQGLQAGICVMAGATERKRAGGQQTAWQAQPKALGPALSVRFEGHTAQQTLGINSTVSVPRGPRERPRKQGP